MRDDLIDAQASADWAVSQLPAFKARLEGWLNDNIYIAIAEQPADSPNNVIVAREKERLPAVFQVEAGAYLNAIRSSLDILAATLARRHCPELVKDAYFPIASDSQTFFGGNPKGMKFVRALPKLVRDQIEALKPYKGGNDALYVMHHLDITRKHHRLLAVEIEPHHMRIVGTGLGDTFHVIGGPGWMRSGDDETAIGILAKGAEQPQIELAMRISFSEADHLPGGEVVTVLHNFASMAQAIIALFDTP